MDRLHDRLVFTATLWAIKPNGSGMRPLEPEVQGQRDVAGSFTAHATRLAFTRQVSQSNPAGVGEPTAIFELASSGGPASELLADAAEPAFSPDGHSLAFSSTRDHNGSLSYGDSVSRASELYVARTDGTQPHRLTFTRDINEDAPSWSPTGHVIAYQRGEVTDNAQATGAWAIPQASGRRRVIRADPKLDTWYANPAWRPTPR
ncbi:MAG: hypothetical protein M3Z33_07095 [Actinomycetota bacterium]|nr:hypothetical protein [Actinomycetota bacterium]